jgi:Protein of unknown function (DUF2628)
MPVYTVHEPPRRDEDALGHSLRFRFVRDGFHFWAFLLAPLWMLWHRLWLELIAYALIVGGAVFAMRRVGIEDTAGFWVALFLAVLVGLEASSLVRGKLGRRGFEQVGIVVGDGLEDAERRFFDAWNGDPERPLAAATPAISPFGPASSASSDIVGLFPQPQARP